MAGPEISLQRPTVPWPADASLLGYEFAGLLTEAMSQGCLLSYLGREEHPFADGASWPREEPGADRKLGISLIVGIYALWVGGLLDVVLHTTENGRDTVSLVLAEGSAGELPPLEQEILSILRTHQRSEARALVHRLPLPSRRRGLGAWFFSGAPSAQARGARGWFARTSTSSSDGPSRVQRALDLAKALVALEAGSDVPEEERDRREEATDLIQTGIFEAIRKLP